MCGGFTQAKQPDDACREILSSVKAKVETNQNAKFTTFEAVEYTTQVVAGTNYRIKVDIGDGKFLNVKVFKPLPCNGTELEVTEVTAL